MLWGKDEGGVMLILESLVKKSIFEEGGFVSLRTDKIEPSSRVPGSANEGVRLILIRHVR